MKFPDTDARYILKRAISLKSNRKVRFFKWKDKKYISLMNDLNTKMSLFFLLLAQVMIKQT